MFSLENTELLEILFVLSRWLPLLAFSLHLLTLFAM